MNLRNRCLIFVKVFSLSGALCLAGEPEYLRYEELVNRIDAGEVKSVSLDHYSQIEGIYVADGADHPFHSFRETGSANDVLLVRLLQQKNVAVKIKEKNDHGFPFGSGVSLLAGLLPFLFMFVAPLITLFLAIRINGKLNRLNRGSPNDR